MATYKQIGDMAEAGASIAIDLALDDPKDALKTGLSYGIGLVLTGLGLGGGGSDPDISGQLTKISNQLDEINKSLTVIKAQLAAIQEQMGILINMETYQTWLILNKDLLESISSINTKQQKTIDYGKASNDPGTPALVDTLANEILSTNAGGALVDFNQINLLVKGDGTQDSILKTYVDLLEEMNKQGKLYFRSCVKTYLDYYTSIGYAQMLSIRLQMDAFSYNGNYQNAKTAFEDYQTAVTNQETAFLIGLERMFDFKPKHLSPWDDAKNFAYAVQGTSLHSQGDWHMNEVYYRPMYERFTAEQILANILSIKEGDSRIVLFLLIPKGFNLDYTKIQLESVENPGTYFSPSYPTDIFTPTNGSGSLDLSKRFLFNGLPNGTYKIRDINGTPGFPANTSYYNTGSNHQFFADCYLNYHMAVTNRSRFDYLDIIPYGPG